MKLIILDRDGVINEDRVDYVKSPAELHLIPGAAAAIRAINQQGIKVALATNQSCLEKGIISEQQLAAVHAALQQHLAAEGAHLDKIFYATGRETQPNRYKPAPGMLLEALAAFHASPAETPFIGDALRDLQAAQAAECQPVLVRTGVGLATAQALPAALKDIAIFDDLRQAVAFLL